MWRAANCIPLSVRDGQWYQVDREHSFFSVCLFLRCCKSFFFFLFLLGLGVHRSDVHSFTTFFFFFSFLLRWLEQVATARSTLHPFLRSGKSDTTSWRTAHLVLNLLSLLVNVWSPFFHCFHYFWFCQYFPFFFWCTLIFSLSAHGQLEAKQGNTTMRGKKKTNFKHCQASQRSFSFHKWRKGTQYRYEGENVYVCLPFLLYIFMENYWKPKEQYYSPLFRKQRGSCGFSFFFF